MGAGHSREDKATIMSLVPKKQELVYVPYDCTVGEALTMLRSTGISCLPVGSKVVEGCTELGTLSFMDLLKCFVECKFDEAAFLASPVSRATNLTPTTQFWSTQVHLWQTAWLE